MDNKVNPQSSEHYLGSKGRRYAETGYLPEGLGHRLQAEFFRPFVGPDSNVLDFGCGKGGIASHLDCKRLDGFDVNPYQLEYARRVFFKTYSDYDQPPVAFYDVIYSNHVLEHVLSPLFAMKKVYQWLKPQGIAVFIVPHDCIGNRHQCNFVSSDRNHHLFTWTPLSLGNLFTEAGLQVQRCCVLKTAWHPKLFAIHQAPLIGPLSRRLVCSLLKRYQILCVGKK